MEWSIREGRFGDLVRVHCNEYLDHYGVYINDSEIIQFGKNPTLRENVSESEVVVLSTDIDEFRNGAIPEFADMTFNDKSERHDPLRSVELAKARIGESGYNVIYNNCEHFAYECVFGKKYSSQEAKVRMLIKETAMGKLVKGDET